MHARLPHVPQEWIPDGVWLNVVALSAMDAFRDIPRRRAALRRRLARLVRRMPVLAAVLLWVYAAAANVGTSCAGHAHGWWAAVLCLHSYAGTSRTSYPVTAALHV